MVILESVEVILTNAWNCCKQLVPEEQVNFSMLKERNVQGSTVDMKS
jgi:hypothetical protein